LRVAFDDDLSSDLDPFQDRPYISGQVAFVDVQRFHTWDHSVSSSSLSPQLGLAFTGSGRQARTVASKC
jgi:hypothetical protein